MATISYRKNICDRCGEFIEIEEASDPLGLRPYPPKWQNITLGQTGANLDLCEACNCKLFDFLVEEEASNMDKACFNKREVL